MSERSEHRGRYLAFSLGHEVYALDILEVSEIVEFRAPTVVPMMPYFLRGVLNLRGRALPVIDLAARFGRGETTVARRTAIIVVSVPISVPISAPISAPDSGPGSAARADVGLMVDTVNQVMELSAASIAPPPAFGAGARAEFIRGMAHHENDFIIVLDVSSMLTGAELTQLTHLTELSQDAEGAA